MTYRLLLRRLPQIQSTYRSQALCLVRSTMLSSSPNGCSPQGRAYRATCLRLDDTDKSADASDSTVPVDVTSETTVSEEYEFKIPKYADRPADCPAWQNPLHHNNPEMQKMFIEDFPEGEMPILPLPPFDDRNPPHIEALADDILHLNMLEMHQLVKMIQDHFGWTDEDFDGEIMMGSGGGDGGGEEVVAAVVEEKTTFDLKLQSYDDKAKIKVIKEIRAITGLGLKEAKELVEGAPKVVKKGIKKEEADELKTKLEEIGAIIEIV